MIPFLYLLLALDLSGAARDLARNVAAAVGRDSVTVTMRNQSSLDAADVAAIRRLIEGELKTGGAHGGDAAAADELRLTISENLTHVVLTAELKRGDEREVFIESWLRPAGKGRERAAQVSIERKLLWEQDQPILDVAQADGVLFILDAARVLLVRGAEQQTAPIQALRPWPRDLRGRLSVSGATFTAWLPGETCQGKMEPFGVACQESQDGWPLATGATAEFGATRNYFAGRVDIEKWGAREVPPFYSAATTGPTWIFAGEDGRARVYKNGWQPVGSIEGWGSDIASAQTPCGPRILATRVAPPEAIEPFELMDGTPRAAGPPLEFSGPVTALWTSGSGAIAVSHNLETGRYAAYSLAPACGS